MVTQRAYKFRFYPTPTQKRQLAIEFGHARYVWNWALETRTQAYKENGESLNNELRRQMEYKAAWYGREVLLVDRWAPTSKTCSECGTVQEAMPLKVREWLCPDCGTQHDKDINAAKNVLSFGTVGSTGTEKARGAVKTPRAVA